MRYQKFSPAECLLPYVECCFIRDSTTRLEDEFVVESPPSGFCSIVFNYSDPYFLQNSKYTRMRVSQQFIAGQSPSFERTL